MLMNSNIFSTAQLCQMSITVYKMPLVYNEMVFNKNSAFQKIRLWSSSYHISSTTMAVCNLWYKISKFWIMNTIINEIIFSLHMPYLCFKFKMKYLLLPLHVALLFCLFYFPLQFAEHWVDFDLNLRLILCFRLSSPWLKKGGKKPYFKLPK